MNWKRNKSLVLIHLKWLKDPNKDYGKNPDWKVTSDTLVLVFFFENWNDRNSSAICCWKYELTPTHLEIRVLIGHVRSFRHRNNRFIICSWRCIGFVLLVPFIIQGFKFIEQTFGPEKSRIGLLEQQTLMIQTFEVILFVLFPPGFVKVLLDLPPFFVLWFQSAKYQRNSNL